MLQGIYRLERTEGVVQGPDVQLDLALPSDVSILVPTMPLGSFAWEQAGCLVVYHQGC